MGILMQMCKRPFSQHFLVSEHHSKLAANINGARKVKHSLAVAWLDIANVYGSIHHSLIQFALQRYHAPTGVCNLLQSWYDGLSYDYSVLYLFYVCPPMNKLPLLQSESVQFTLHLAAALNAVNPLHAPHANIVLSYTSKYSLKRSRMAPKTIQLALYEFFVLLL